MAPPEVSMPTLAPLVGMTVVTLATCCVDNGYPPASVSWDTISLGDTVNITTMSAVNEDGTINVTSNLIGLPTRDIHKKEVQCLVTHATLNGTSISNYAINVEYPPFSVRVHLQSRDPILTFQCEANANPQANYTWTRDDLPLPIGVRSNGRELIFQTSTPDMNALYHCEVSNKYGSATTSLHLYPANSSGTPSEYNYRFSNTIVFFIMFAFYLDRAVNSGTGNE
ncbi:poliovirus receptor homolog [Engraulis encrasicolus]|uniref:poliovirus receptor homolog n=1 Tax=Engraulis encrasicolus TaxID=184585 RepID=UPI002FD5C6AA